MIEAHILVLEVEWLISELSKTIIIIVIIIIHYLGSDSIKIRLTFKNSNFHPQWGDMSGVRGN